MDRIWLIKTERESMDSRATYLDIGSVLSPHFSHNYTPMKDWFSWVMTVWNSKWYFGKSWMTPIGCIDRYDDIFTKAWLSGEGHICLNWDFSNILLIPWHIYGQYFRPNAHQSIFPQTSFRMPMIISSFETNGLTK